MTGLEGVFAAAVEVEGFCRGRGWAFCFIGGIVVQRWGMPRFTQDVDVTLLTGFGGEEAFVDAIMGQFPARRADTRELALTRRILLVQTAGGIPIDFSLGALPFEDEAIARATAWKVSETISITTVTAEDLIVQKAFANRDHDWGDVETVLARQHGRLNLGQVRRDLRPLLEMNEDLAPMEKLERKIAEVAGRLRK